MISENILLVEWAGNHGVISAFVSMLGFDVLEMSQVLEKILSTILLLFQLPLVKYVVVAGQRTIRFAMTIVTHLENLGDGSAGRVISDLVFLQITLVLLKRL